jgi:hypothetical protein
MTNQESTLLRKVAVAIIETVRESGSMGAPAGPMYAAMMSYGFSLENFEQIMAGLVAAKMLRKSGHLYFIDKDISAAPIVTSQVR